LTRSRVKKFLSYYRPYRGLFLILMLCAFLVAAITVAFPLCIRFITKTVLENPGPGALGQIYGMGGVMLALLAVQTAANFFVDYRGHAMGALMERDLRRELFEHYQKLSFRFYDEQKTGQLMSRITNDLFAMAEFYHHAPEDLIISMVRFLGAFIVLSLIDFKLTLIVFVFLPPLAVFAWIFNTRMHAALKRVRERTGDINAQVEDTLAGIRVVKSFSNEDTEKEKFARENNRFLEARKHGYKNEAYFSEGVDLLTQMISVTLVVFGGIAILNTQLDLADLITFLLYIGYLIEPVRKFLHTAGQFQEGVTGFERFMEIIEITPEIQDAPGAIELKEVKGAIEFRDVGFRYQEHHAHVLKNLSLTVSAGEYIALVGSSGVGKTTLCSLIPRFYEVSEGEICLDGVNIKDIRLDSLRRSVGVVQQDVYLFAGTVYDNIRYGKPGATRAEVIAAARQANAHDFILSLPDGYDTDIGQRGVKLSGGQKQRLSIARVFLKNPPVLIFDEATSSLDNESEKVVQESLEALAKNRTTFVIAHRLSTIRSARRILVLSDRGIEEEGTHAELIAQEGAYARLYNLQFNLNGTGG
jgi:ATP-binding cassette, subfamily B, bacterial